MQYVSQEFIIWTTHWDNTKNEQLNNTWYNLFLGHSSSSLFILFSNTWYYTLSMGWIGYLAGRRRHSRLEGCPIQSRGCCLWISYHKFPQFRIVELLPFSIISMTGSYTEFLSRFSIDSICIVISSQLYIAKSVRLFEDCHRITNSMFAIILPHGRQ